MLTTKRAAVAAGQPRYNTGKPCKNGHLADRYVSGHCVTCMRGWEVAYAKEHRSEAASRSQRWRAKNPEKVQEGSRKHREANREKCREAHRVWRKENAATWREIQAARRTRQGSATLSGYKEQLREIYTLCPPGLQVDHIHPINGKNFCGLHVPWNLQYLSPEENLKKSNRLPAEFSDLVWS